MINDADDSSAYMNKLLHSITFIITNINQFDIDPIILLRILCLFKNCTLYYSLLTQLEHWYGEVKIQSYLSLLDLK